MEKDGCYGGREGFMGRQTPYGPGGATQHPTFFSPQNYLSQGFMRQNIPCSPELAAQNFMFINAGDTHSYSMGQNLEGSVQPSISFNHENLFSQGFTGQVLPHGPEGAAQPFMFFNSADISSYSMGQNSPFSPRGEAQHFLFSNCETSMAPIERSMPFEQGTSVSNAWNNGSAEVPVVGSLHDQYEEMPSERQGENITNMVLLSGIHYKMDIDSGDVEFGPSVPSVDDQMGYECQVLKVQDSVAENLKNLADFEPPASPESSYDNQPLVAEDFVREPPMVPPSLHFSSLDEPSSDLKPFFGSLNHLYVKKDGNKRAIGMTHRLGDKFVNVVKHNPSA